jgi:CDP-diacylglycerol--glycerol-3-phosphate 3-phosphatidyltransferase
MKYLPNLISIGRIIGSVSLLLMPPLSTAFFLMYALCCVSDVLDGYVAKKAKTTSRSGEVLDSVADLVLVSVMLIIFIPLVTGEPWVLLWIAGVAIVRITSLVIGYVKYRALSFLHTYANKVTGVVLACFPFLYLAFGLTVTAIILGSIASYSALEELLITIRSKNLDRNVKGFG